MDMLGSAYGFSKIAPLLPASVKRNARYRPLQAIELPNTLDGRAHRPLCPSSSPVRAPTLKAAPTPTRYFPYPMDRTKRASMFDKKLTDHQCASGCPAPAFCNCNSWASARRNPPIAGCLWLPPPSYPDWAAGQRTNAQPVCDCISRWQLFKTYRRVSWRAY